MPKPERLVNDKEGRVYACPECDKAGDITVRRADNTYAGDPDAPYACGKCSATFEEPVDREKKIGGPGPRYADLSPEDLGLDSNV